MKRILSLFLCVSMFLGGVLFATSCCDETVEAINLLYKKDYTFLICGFDDAAENTDVIMLIHYSFDENNAYVVQIPRDTYFKSGSIQNKINQVYAMNRSKGKSEEEALDIFAFDISTALGISIDGYVGFSTDVLAGMIDTIGGIDINLSRDFIIYDSSGREILKLNLGWNSLTGNEAVTFIRHRSSYAMGDIGRVDAQKLVVSAIFNKVKSGLGLGVLLKLFRNHNSELKTNVSFFDILNIGIKNRGRFGNMNVKYVTIPGQSVQSCGGLWYYSIAKFPSEGVLDTMGFSSGLFDPDSKFVKSDEDSFVDIYYSSTIKAKVYTDDDLFDLDVKKK